MSDLIDREEAYKVLTEQYHHKAELQHEALRDALARVPSAEKRGEWTTKRTIVHDGEWYCTACGSEQPNISTVMGKPNWAYCPNCGAKMESEE